MGTFIAVVAALLFVFVILPIAISNAGGIVSGIGTAIGVVFLLGFIAMAVMCG
jgi:hypothetical protein